MTTDAIRAAADDLETVVAPPPEGDAAAAGALPPLEAYDDPDDLVRQGAALPANDFGNGKRLVLYYGQDCLYVPRLGWFRWDGKRWAQDEDGILVRRDAQRVAAAIAHEITCFEQGMEETDKEFQARKNRHLGFAIGSGNSSRISNMMTEAQTDLAVSIDDLNRDKWSLCVGNGVLHFYYGRDDHSEAWGGPARVPRVDLLPHSRAQRITKLAAAEYRPEAACPTWCAFLERVQPDPDMRAFLRRWLGYCLLGVTSEQVLVFNYGSGRNGKSTAMDVIAAIMGDYATTLPIESLTGDGAGKGSEATPDLVRLPGARFVRASEPEQGQKMREARVKALTGGEPFPIRRLHQEAVDLVPEFKLNISGNYRPEVRGADDGIWRRILLVLWGEQIPADEVDPHLTDKLKSERDGILRWMVEGCLEWMRTGLRPPKAIADATADYRETSDPMRAFLETECEVTGDPGNFETARDLAAAFNAWRLDCGDGVWTARTTSNRLKERAGLALKPHGASYRPVKRSTTGYAGISLKGAARDRIATYSEQMRRAGL